MKIISLALTVLFIAFLTSSCNKPEPFGAELLDSDKLDTEFTDTITIVASTVLGDSISTFDLSRGFELGTFLCGDLVDPIFGKTSASIYAKFGLNGNPNWILENQDSVFFDSLVLGLRYYAILGDDTAEQSIQVHELDEILADEDVSYFSNQSFQFKNQPLIDQGAFVPNILDTTYLLGQSNDTTEIIPPNFRYTIDDPNFLDFLTDEAKYITYNSSGDPEIDDSKFYDQNIGIHIKGGADSRSMMRLLLNSIHSNMSLYYRVLDSTEFAFTLKYNFPTNKVSTVHLEHDYSSSIVDEYLNDTSKGDSLLFLHSAGGTKVKFEFPNITDFEDVLINKAELELTVVEDVQGLDDFEYELYPPVSRVIGSYINSDGESKTIRDFSIADTDFSQGYLNTDTLSNGNLLRTYKVNISAQVQDMIDDKVENVIYLSSLFSGENITRSIIYGPGSSNYGAKLNIRYTKF